MLPRQMRLSVLNIEFTSKSIYLQVIKKQKRLTEMRGGTTRRKSFFSVVKECGEKDTNQVTFLNWSLDTVNI